MGFLDGNKDDIKYLNSEKEKLWERIVSLEEYTKELKDELNHKSSDSEKEAKGHSKKASEYRNKTEKRLEEASDLLNSINSELDKSKELIQEVESVKEASGNNLEEIQSANKRVKELEGSYNEKLEKLDSHIESIESFFEKYPDLDRELSDVDEFVQKVEENKKKSSLTLAEINNKKKELDELYLDIFGYEADDEDGGTVPVDGLKDKLENSYEEIKDQVDILANKVDNINEISIEKYKIFEKKHKDEYERINEEIKKLLPNALTAGLSAAFSNKKKEEEESAISHRKQFNRYRDINCRKYYSSSC